MSRCYKKLLLKAIRSAHCKIHFRDYLLHSPHLTSQETSDTIGKNDDKTTEKPEKKEKKIKPQMSESRVKKFHKLFGQQVSTEERLINYFSCALVAEILLQGHLYVSQNYFSFYSNVFGYVTKLVIPCATVVSITKEKTAKFFPNAIALTLNDGKHVFGSFISREVAYQLMSSICKKNEISIETTESIEEVEPDEIDAVQAQDVEISSLEDSSSISGSEGPAQFKIPISIATSEVIEEEPTTPTTPTKPPPISRNLHLISDVPVSATDPIGKVGNYDVKLMSEFNILFVGICLTILLAFFSGLLLVKINSIEKHSATSANLNEFDGIKLTIEDAESILNKNVLIVRNVRKKLEDLQKLLQNSFDKMPTLNEQQEL